LDKFARWYAWFLLVATALPAIVRLASPRQLALVTSQRLATGSRRTRHRQLGWLSLVGSLVLVPVYLFYSRQRWLVVAFFIGVLTGVEMLRNSASPGEESLVRQNRLFGVVYAACAVITYFVLIRK
jgi:hypothetical protein